VHDHGHFVYGPLKYVQNFEAKNIQTPLTRCFRVDLRVMAEFNSYQIFLDFKLPNKFLYKLPPWDRLIFRHCVTFIRATRYIL
jgi:hypothetical protein